MKLGTKIVLYGTVFFSVAFLLGGYTLISYFNQIVMEREIEGAVECYQYNKFVVQANLITKGEEWFEGAVGGKYNMGDMVSDMNGTTALFSMDGRELYSEFPANFKAGQQSETAQDILLKDAASDTVNYQFLKIAGRTYLLVMGLVSYSDTGFYLMTGVDVERVLEQQGQMINKFRAVYLAAVGTGLLMLIGLSALLTRRIKHLTEATKKIAAGNYKERVEDTGEDEVGQLAGNFNKMALAVEEKMKELSDNAKQKEDFAASFAHELKTPLTSIIGYANRMYRKELAGEEQKQAAWYIWNEGMRLESLALKLMDLTILNHKDFVLQEMRAELLFRELASDMEYFITEKGISIRYAVEDVYIRIEYDLFHSLFSNLIDNAVKAGAKHIEVTGRIGNKENRAPDVGDGTSFYYIIEVTDDGKGIPEEDIKRITEAFYMVDKSRSRKQHGAGIGLTLAEKIARIHGSSLEFESDGQSWTKVSFCLKCKGEGSDEQR